MTPTALNHFMRSPPEKCSLSRVFAALHVRHAIIPLVLDASVLQNALGGHVPAILVRVAADKRNLHELSQGPARELLDGFLRRDAMVRGFDLEIHVAASDPPFLHDF